MSSPDSSPVLIPYAPGRDLLLVYIFERGFSKTASEIRPSVAPFRVKKVRFFPEGCHLFCRQKNDTFTAVKRWLLCFLVFPFRAAGSQADSLFALGQYAEVLEFRLQALPELERRGMCKPLAVGYLQVGRAYYYLQKKEEARVWLRRSMEKAAACSFDSLVGINLRNLGAIWIESGRFDSAYGYLERARKVLVPGRNYPEIASLFAMLFEMELRGRRDTRQARTWLDSCRLYTQKVNDPNQWAFYFVKEGIYGQEVGDFDRSESYFKQALDRYRSLASTEGSMYALTCLASVQSAMGKHREAFETQTRYIGIRDTVFRSQTADHLARYQARFETQKKEIENLELKQQNDRQLTSFGLGLVVLLLGGAGFFVWREMAHRKRLDGQKREGQRRRFAEVVQAQEEERTRIARDLHDGLGHLMAAIKLNTSALEVADAQNRKILVHTEGIIDQASKEVRQIAHRLMPQSLSDLGLAESIRELAHRFNESGKICIRVEASDPVNLDKQMAIGLYRIVQELVNNALRHAGASEITIRYGMDGQDFELQVADNGKGFAVDPSDGHAGLGLKNMQSRVEILKGRLELHSGPGEGTRVSVWVPLTFKSN